MDASRKHRASVVSAISPPDAMRLLRAIRWLLPVLLAAVALFYEGSEHLTGANPEATPGFVGEIVLFALAGPMVVAVTLGWLTKLVADNRATSDALAAANEGLEASVADRTRTLQTTTEQLAEANRGLAQANEELRQLDRLKSEFVSLVSHQLRAPLTNINGALELVAEDAERLPAGSRRTLEILTLESQRLSRLIQTILDVSRLEAGRLAPRLGPVAIEPILDRAYRSCMAAEPENRCSVLVDVGLPPAWADEVLLEEVVRNLVENAARYAPPDSPIEIAASATGVGVQIRITDHGPGISEDEQQRVFRSFHRIDAEETAVAGYGLGLYFADKLTRAQGGTIRVESPVWDDTAAPGARFVVSLPIAGDEPGTRAPASDDST